MFASSATSNKVTGASGSDPRYRDALACDTPMLRFVPPAIDAKTGPLTTSTAVWPVQIRQH